MTATTGPWISDAEAEVMTAAASGFMLSHGTGNGRESYVWLTGHPHRINPSTGHTAAGRADPGVSAAELEVMQAAGKAFLASQGTSGRTDHVRVNGLYQINPPSTAFSGLTAAAQAVPAAQRGMWRWPDPKNVNKHDDPDPLASFHPSTGIAGSELDIMRQAGAAFLGRLLGGPA